MLILPLTIKLFKPKSAAPVAPTAGSPNADAHIGPKSDKSQSAQFDLNLARVAAFIDFASYVLMGLAESALPFTMFTLLASLGTGFGPAVQAVALELYSRRGETETGKLFGALSVVNALWLVVLAVCSFLLAANLTVRSSVVKS